eukprot:GHVP01031608.1.p2 GENE.GHVP01031608.1~~GHVP01031608.1.p2  ORF type:complete len:497 (+),score=74.36 GHVP01031608.1:1666-3156(+)
MPAPAAEKAETSAEQQTETTNEAKEPIVTPTYDNELVIVAETLYQSVLNNEPRNNTSVLRRIQGLRQIIDLGLTVEYFRATKAASSDLGGICDLFIKCILDHTEDLEPIAETRMPTVKELAAPEMLTFLAALTGSYFTLIQKYHTILEPLRTLVSQNLSTNRKTLEGLSAKVIFILSFVQERLGQLSSLRPFLMNLYRHFVLKHQSIEQAVVITCLLRTWILENQIDQAEKFVSMTTFPENVRSNAVLSRFLYYTGYLAAVQLDYSEASHKFTQVLRKLPTEGRQCIAFRIAAQKMSIIVTLLMGEYPSRSIFSDPYMKEDLIPYFKLAKAVQMGDVVEFKEVLQGHSPIFEEDRVLLLVHRLQQSVIRSCLRTISLSYSRISLKDVAAKLDCSDPKEIEGVLGKAVLDGIIDVSIDDENKWLVSNKKGGIYATQEPAKAFHQRISFCLDLYSEAVKALHYPATEKAGNPKQTDEERLEAIESLNRAGSEDMTDDW